MPPDRAMAFDRMLSGVLIAAGLIAAFALQDSYLLRLLAVAGCYAILAIGYQRLFGELGVLSLAQGAFFAVGGYATAILGIHGDWDGLLLLPAAGALAACLALAAAPPLLKLASHYFALASLAVAQLVLLAAVNLERLTGGANGLSALPPLRLAGGTIVQGGPLTATIWGVVLLCAAAFWLPGPLAMLRRHVLRDAPLAAQAMGLESARWRVSALAFAGGCGGLAGGLYAQATGVVAPDIAEFAVMINVLAITIIGGRGRVAGAIVGALILAFLPEVLRVLGGWQLFAWGAAMLAMLIVAPGGLVGLAGKFYPRQRNGSLPAQLAAALPAPRAGILQAQGLTRRFGGVVALDDVSLTIGPGEIVGLIGANGAGKTTLLNLLSGFERTDGGRILWRGIDIAASPVHERARLGLARSFQIDHLPGDISALDAVAMAAPEKADIAIARGVALAVLDELALGQFAATKMSALSPATRRLVDIARAMIAGPGILLLDEPTSGLALDERNSLGEALRRLRDHGPGQLIVEHDLAFMLSLADRLICLDQGRVVADGKPHVLARQPELRRFFGRHASPP